jgi:peptide-methionine (R)-S-oxide reductase
MYLKSEKKEKTGTWHFLPRLKSWVSTPIIYEWHYRLSDEQYRDNHDAGIYKCAGCGEILFASHDKFESGTGWPSFTKPAADGNVETKADLSHGMVRKEAFCSKCGGHLGHVFDDGPGPNGKRFCINSISLDFAKTE